MTEKRAIHTNQRGSFTYTTRTAENIYFLLQGIRKRLVTANFLLFFKPVLNFTFALVFLD